MCKEFIQTTQEKMTGKNSIQYKPSGPQIPDHSNRILILGNRDHET